MEAKARPWTYYTTRGRGTFVITQCDGRTIATLPHPVGHFRWEEDCANAAFIVQAANAHDKLVDALHDLVSVCYALPSHDPNFVIKGMAALKLAKGE